jgi:glycosyltransferase involved in cell wall biosynthesis
VIYPGVEPRFRPISDQAALEHVRRKYNLPPQFVLGLGTIQPRKNYARLIEAFGRASLSEVSLVIVGGNGWLYEDTFARVPELGLEDRVLFTGFVDDDDLPALYNLAHILAFPSLYEGFGIPLLESMACGTPVVSADNSSLPEAVGDAGLLVNAYDIQSLANAIDQLATDTKLRQTMISRGLARAQIFTWRQAALALLTTYMRVCGA